MGSLSGRKVLSLGVAAALAGVLLYYSLRGIQWHEVARIIKSADAAAALGLEISHRKSREAVRTGTGSRARCSALRLTTPS